MAFLARELDAKSATRAKSQNNTQDYVVMAPRRNRSASVSVGGSDGAQSTARDRRSSTGSVSNVSLHAVSSLADDAQIVSRSGRPILRPLRQWAEETYLYTDGEITGVLRADEVETSQTAVVPRRLRSILRRQSRITRSKSRTSVSRKQVRFESQAAGDDNSQVALEASLDDDEDAATALLSGLTVQDDGRDDEADEPSFEGALAGDSYEEPDDDGHRSADSSDEDTSDDTIDSAKPWLGKYSDVPEAPASVKRAAELARVDYASLRQQGRWRLIREVWDREWEYHKTFRGHTESEWHDMAMQTLLSTDDRLLEVILCGNVQKARRSDPSLDELLDVMWERSHSQLCHYMFEFVDPDTGESPTPRELVRILDVLRRYLGNDPADCDEIEQIDTARRYRAYNRAALEAGSRRYLNSSRAPAVSKDFIGQLTAYLQDLDPDTPLHQPLREVGYAKSGPERVKSHKSYSGSTYLMVMFEVFAVHLDLPYRNEAVVVSLYFEKGQAALGEILWSCLASSYAKTGRGLNHSPAGGSNQSALRSDFALLGQKDLSEWYDWIWEKSPYQINLADEQRAIESAHEEVASLKDHLIRDLRQSERISTDETLEPWDFFLKMQADGAFASKEEEAEARVHVVEHLYVQGFLRRDFRELLRHLDPARTKWVSSSSERDRRK